MYLFFTPQFPPDGWENSQPEGTPTVCQTKKQKKKRKEKQNRENKKFRNFCRIPGDLNLILPRSTCRMTAECDYFCFRKILKKIFPIPSAGTDILRNVPFGCFCTLFRGSFAANALKVV